MSFEVGDRVVISDLPGEIGRRGEVTKTDAHDDWNIQIRFDDSECLGLARESEIELEAVYDALSAPLKEKSIEEVLFHEVKVAERDESLEGFLELMDSIPMPEANAVNHPPHYADGWSNGAEVIDITEHLNFNRGNAVKYLARAGKKGGPEKELEDLQKALWYVTREVQRLGGSV